MQICCWCNSLNTTYLNKKSLIGLEKTPVYIKKLKTSGFGKSFQHLFHIFIKIESYFSESIKQNSDVAICVNKM